MADFPLFPVPPKLKELIMSLNAEQIMLVQSSFAKVKPISDQAAALFYARLFEIAPQVKPMFKGDMVEQGRKLMAMLNTVVNGLNNLQAIVPAAQNLARGHVGYGVRSEHYAYVGSALLYALEQGLGKDFTPAVKQAWSDAYGLLSGVMIAAAEQVESRSAA
ncbi:Hemoglobin-like flavoprotein [Thiomonas bhubaneswarensis]|uniref:Hemoglobin-like flavoprotein n=2 Tax=Thiomonas bhubaneswarensis TaxID=339866 RepID=A0A0K6I870_9BURK|nr:Hemoglobin-like flavoprotein [Thiomonas bhubaneswarensis]